MLIKNNELCGLAAAFSRRCDKCSVCHWPQGSPAHSACNCYVSRCRMWTGPARKGTRPIFLNGEQSRDTICWFSLCVCVCGGGGGRGQELVQILPVWTDSGQFPLNSICLIYYAFYYDNQQKCSANVLFCHSDWINSNERTKNATIFSWSPNIAFHLCRFSVTNWQEVAKESVKVSVALYCWYNNFNVTKTKLAC